MLVPSQYNVWKVQYAKACACSYGFWLVSAGVLSEWAAREFEGPWSETRSFLLLHSAWQRSQVGDLESQVAIYV